MLHTAALTALPVDWPKSVVQTTSAGKLVMNAMATAFIRVPLDPLQALWSVQSFLSPSLLPSHLVFAVLFARTTATERPASGDISSLCRLVTT